MSVSNYIIIHSKNKKALHDVHLKFCKIDLSEVNVTNIFVCKSHIEVCRDLGPVRGIIAKAIHLIPACFLRNIYFSLILSTYNILF